MISKTEGVVLQTLKYSDSGIISHILTKKYGLLSFIVKGVHSKKSKTKKAYFQPLQVLNLEISFKAGRNLQSLSEVSASVALRNIPFDPFRNSMAFFVGEVLHKTVNENEPNLPLYEYVFDNIMFLDESSNIINFHIGFMVGLARFIGIAPSANYSEDFSYFDMQDGTFVKERPLHGFYLDQKFSGLLYQFSISSMGECNSIALTGSMRSVFLESLISYFAMHLPGLKKIKSLEVLTEVFNQ